MCTSLWLLVNHVDVLHGIPAVCCFIHKNPLIVRFIIISYIHKSAANDMLSQNPSDPPPPVQLKTISVSTYFSYSNVNVTVVFSLAVSYLLAFTSYVSHTMENSCINTLALV